jgi:DUF971 family protein
MPTNPANQPIAIKALREEGRLLVDWADGHHTEYDAATLRLLCPCAFCQGEAGTPGWLSTNPALTAQQTQLVNVTMVGQYAIAPTWGDGHDTGYYTFEALRADCQCAQCIANRKG